MFKTGCRPAATRCHREGRVLCLDQACQASMAGARERLVFRSETDAPDNSSQQACGVAAQCPRSLRCSRRCRTQGQHCRHEQGYVSARAAREKPITLEEAGRILSASAMPSRGPLLLAILGHDDLAVEWLGEDAGDFPYEFITALPVTMHETFGFRISDLHPHWAVGSSQLVAQMLARDNDAFYRTRSLARARQMRGKGRRDQTKRLSCHELLRSASLSPSLKRRKPFLHCQRPCA